MSRRIGVEALSREIGRVLQRHWPTIWVEGEVGQLQTPASGHAYLVLREGNASLNTVMWRNDWRASSYRPRVGDRVICRGRIGAWEVQSRYQLYATVIRPAGLGALQRELEARRARLEAEGLLDPRRKRALPAWPRVVGVVTSLTGAALQDFLRVSRERFPAARLLVVGCAVQGAEAPASMIRALELLYEDGRPEVIVLTRGGGAKADLLAFWDEHLARWIARAPVPVISAVGHEIDTTLADLVADVVSPTPSAAAVRALPDGQSLAQRVDEAVMGLSAAALRGVAQRRFAVEGLVARLRHPGERLARHRVRRDELAWRLDLAMRRILARHRQRLEVEDRMAPAVQRVFTDRRRELAVEERLMPAVRQLLAARRRGMEACERALTALSPFAVLHRGYAIVSGSEGVITEPDQVKTGDPLEVRVRDGAFGVVVR